MPYKFILDYQEAMIIEDVPEYIEVPVNDIDGWVIDMMLAEIEYLS